MAKAGTITFSLAAAAAAVAGAYYLYGKNGVRHRRELRRGVEKAKQEIARQVKKIKNLDRKTYNLVVDKVARGYRAIKEIDPQDVSELISELRGYWQTISRSSKKRPAR